MRPDDINALLRRKPFQPFRVHLSNGQIYDVRHPEQAIVTRNTMVVGLPGPDLPETTYDHFALVTLLHINNVESLPTSSTPPNGAGA